MMKLYKRILKCKHLIILILLCLICISCGNDREREEDKDWDPSINASEYDLDFGEVAINTEETRTVELDNDKGCGGGYDAWITSIELSDNINFEIVNYYIENIEYSKSCDLTEYIIEYAFKPGSVGDHSCKITVYLEGYGDYSTTLEFTVKGKGI